ncbi:MAG: hypothetical protein J6Y54_02515 [Lentisphaeria bacterium]|nr:hypothetical protein [Lentisphaeria bacterium]
MRLKHRPAEQLKQKPHIVAFLDFLGAADKMKSEKESDEFLQEIYTVYAFARHIVKRTENERNRKLKIKIFSDNILIAEEIEDFQNSGSILRAYTDVEQFAILMYTNALLNQNLMRGAISRGMLYMDDTFAFGEALIDAYYIESKIANYPRIVVNQNIWHKSNLPDKVELIKCDVDGELFLSPFWGIPKVAEGDKIKANILLMGIKKIIQDEYIEAIAKGKMAVAPKINWLANQFNDYCSKNSFNFYIDLYKVVIEKQL